MLKTKSNTQIQMSVRKKTRSCEKKSSTSSYITIHNMTYKDSKANIRDDGMMPSHLM